MKIELEKHGEGLWSVTLRLGLRSPEDAGRSLARDVRECLGALSDVVQGMYDDHDDEPETMQ